MQELRSIRATQDQQQRMQEILQRLHEAELADDGGSSSSDEGGSGSSAGGGVGGGGGAAEAEGLSEATLHRLLARLQASDGKDIDISEEDLTPAELAAFHRALAAGELSSAVAPWQPWWLGDDAAALQLGAGGTRLVAEGEEGAGGGAGLGEPDGSGGGDLPAPPSRPLPPLAALTRMAPSPLLQYQLLDLLYAYAFTLRLFNGDYGPVAAEAADTALALSAVLAATAGSGGGNATESNSAAAPSAASVLLSCVGHACAPPAGSREQRSFAVGVLADVVALLARGRVLALLALLDLSRLLEAAKQQAAGKRGAGAGKSRGSRAVARRLVAAQRKLVFFLSWANELPEEAYALLRAAVEAEQRKHAATLPAAAAARGQQEQSSGSGVEEILRGAAAAHAEAAVKSATRTVIEELQA